MRAPPSKKRERLFSAIVLVTATNKSPEIAVRILISKKKSIHSNHSIKFA